MGVFMLKRLIRSVCIPQLYTLRRSQNCLQKKEGENAQIIGRWSVYDVKGTQGFGTRETQDKDQKSTEF